MRCFVLHWCILITTNFSVENVTIASIGVGLFVLVGFYKDDTDKEMDYL